MFDNSSPGDQPSLFASDTGPRRQTGLDFSFRLRFLDLLENL